MSSKPKSSKLATAVFAALLVSGSVTAGPMEELIAGSKEQPLVVLSTKGYSGSSGPVWGVDLTPGLFGLLSNIVGIAVNPNRILSDGIKPNDVTPDRITVTYLTPGAGCSQGAMVFESYVRMLQTLPPGSLISLRKDEVDRPVAVKVPDPDGEPTAIAQDHACYDQLKAHMEKSGR